MSRTVCIIQARMTSSRLPGKVLLPLAGRPIIEHLLLRAVSSFGVQNTIVGIPHGVEQQPLRDYLSDLPLCYAYAGSEDDVWARYVAGIGLFNLQTDDWIVRLTGDCPWLPLEELRIAFAPAEQPSPSAYRSNTNLVPTGWTVQVIQVRALLALAARDDFTPQQREHVCSILDRPEDLQAMHKGGADRPVMPDDFRCTLDTPGDYAWFQAVAAEIDVTPPLHPTPQELLALFARRPDLIRTQGDYEREKAAADLRQ